MAHVILTGATGTCGAFVLAHLLKQPASAISRISVLSRRPVKQAEGNDRVHVIIHKDFLTYPDEVLQQLHGATSCIWAQGISSAGMNESDYTKITLDYPLSAATAFATLPAASTSTSTTTSGDGPPRFNFVYVSGEGASTQEKGQLFARVKGRAENRLLALMASRPSLRVYNVRPGWIDPGKKTLAERGTNWIDRAAVVVGPPLKVFWPSGHSPAEKLAEVLVRLAVGDGEPVTEGNGVEMSGRLLRNVAVRRMAGL